ncbi:hypothetical protein EON67_03060 [archaeon]|nr:MAG: hypothetical protein EON67_03060 [archaeon]
MQGCVRGKHVRKQGQLTGGYTHVPPFFLERNTFLGRGAAGVTYKTKGVHESVPPINNSFLLLDIKRA